MTLDYRYARRRLFLPPHPGCYVHAVTSVTDWNDAYHYIRITQSSDNLIRMAQCNENIRYSASKVVNSNTLKKAHSNKYNIKSFSSICINLQKALQGCLVKTIVRRFQSPYFPPQCNCDNYKKSSENQDRKILVFPQWVQPHSCLVEQAIKYVAGCACFETDVSWDHRLQ